MLSWTSRSIPASHSNLEVNLSIVDGSNPLSSETLVQARVKQLNALSVISGLEKSSVERLQRLLVSSEECNKLEVRIGPSPGELYLSMTDELLSSMSSPVFRQRTSARCRMSVLAGWPA